MASSDLGTLEQALDYQFKKRELIIEALTHRSHHHEFGDSLHNERLEFLGDSVIDLCVTEALMRLSPDTDEGKLSKLRSQLVSEPSLARAARRLGLGQEVRLGKGEDQSGGRERDALLADTFEAVLAAIYLDGGFEVARRVTLRTLEVGGAGRDETPWTEATEKLLRRDFKSRLQELCQSVGLGAPSYRCVETRGPDHQRRFVMALFVLEREALRSEGATKKEATQEAAREVLEKTGTSESLLRFLAERGVPVPGNSEVRRKKTTSNKSPSKVKSKPAQARAPQEGSHEH